ncbi:lysozyme inhibitor LprI family protein [Flavobacterium sp. NG2]|uniref:lysozyme inhibitor LprI family protein n=1 Tax=Flavobacterium sp. NG2 TaxID=3097547 RepID=UPI002A81370B|nr:lysozyme inhibitor LprI family protein [Flavobacterium sp. NG2]WPR70617.1 lysozyme inhibitor LprI family protein [Flavobacterium sp. NG2]
MKNRLLLLLLLLGTFAHAQSEISKTKLTELKAQVEKEAAKYKDSLAKAGGSFSQPLDIEYKTDVYRIEKLADKKIKIDYSTAGMSNAIYELNSDYDKLLNKYYGILLKKLSIKDQEKLKVTQRNWLKFRDSEIELIGIIAKEEYSGGGTIQSNIRASRISDLTKNRLIEIKEHLNQFLD